MPTFPTRLSMSARHCEADMAARGSTHSMSVVFGLILAMSLVRVCAAGVTIEETIAQLKLIEAKAEPYAFEIESKMQFLDPKTDQETGTNHFRITFDQVPFRRCRLSLFHQVTRWEGGPPGVTVCDTTGEYAILGDSYQSIVLADGEQDPAKRAYPLEGKVSSKSQPYQFVSAFAGSGWSGSLFGMSFSARSSKLSDFIVRCVEARKSAKPGAIAEVSSEASGLIKLKLCMDSRSYISEVLLDPKKGMAPTRWSELFPKNGQVINDIEITELSAIGTTGLFYPKRITYQDFDSDGIPGGKVQSEIVGVRLITKESLSDIDFRIDWPVGSKVTDEDTGKTSIIEPKPGPEDL